VGEKQFPVFFDLWALLQPCFTLSSPHSAFSNHILFILNNLVLRVFWKKLKTIFRGFFEKKETIAQSPSRKFSLTSPGTLWTEGPCQQVAVLKKMMWERGNRVRHWRIMPCRKVCFVGGNKNPLVGPSAGGSDGRPCRSNVVMLSLGTGTGTTGGDEKDNPLLFKLSTCFFNWFEP